MPRILTPLVIVFALCLSFTGHLVAEEGFPEAKGSWVHSAEEGFKASRENKKLVLIDFWYPGCYWCKVLTETVLNTDPVQKSLLAFNLVKINRDANDVNAALCKQYGITAFPSVVFTDADGKVVDTIVGGKHDPKEYARLLDEIAEKGGRLAWLEKRIAEQPKDIELRYQRMMLCKPMYGWKQIETDAGVFLAEASAQTDKRYAEILVLSGQSKSLNKHYASAIEDLERYVSLFPEDKQMSFGMMLIASGNAQLGKVPEAGRWYRRLWRAHPSTYHAGTGASFFLEHPHELRKGMSTPPGASKWDQGVWKKALDAFAKLPEAEQLEDDEANTTAPKAASDGEDF